MTGSAEAIFAMLARFGSLSEAEVTSRRLDIGSSELDGLHDLISRGIAGGDIAGALHVLAVIECKRVEIDWSTLAEQASERLSGIDHAPDTNDYSNRLLRQVLRRADGAAHRGVSDSISVSPGELAPHRSRPTT